VKLIGSKISFQADPLQSEGVVTIRPNKLKLLRFCKKKKRNEADLRGIDMEFSIPEKAWDAWTTIIPLLPDDVIAISDRFVRSPLEV
jgi:hypothetical protein